MTTCSCGRPTAGSWLCERCTTTLTWALANIPTFYSDLDTLAGKQTRYGAGASTMGSIGKEQPLPIDPRFAGSTEDGTQLKYDTKATLVAWARTIMEIQAEVSGPACIDCLHTSCSSVRRRRWPADTVPSLAAYLARQFQLILSEQWATDVFDELVDLERRLSRMVDRPADKVYLGMCDAKVEGEECGGSIYAIEGAMTGKCDQPDCRAEYDVAASREGLADALDSRLCTAAEIARLSTYLGLKADRDRVRKRINQWHTRKRISSTISNDEGDPMFAYKDVKSLLYAEFADTA